MASLADEQRQGRQLTAQLQSAAQTCDDLSDEDFVGPGMMGNSGMGPGTMGDSWRDMSRQDWQRLQQQWLGARTNPDDGLSTWAIIAITFASAALLAIAFLAIIRRRPLRRPPAQPSPS